MQTWLASSTTWMQGLRGGATVTEDSIAALCKALTTGNREERKRSLNDLKKLKQWDQLTTVKHVSGTLDTLIDTLFSETDMEMVAACLEILQPLMDVPEDEELKPIKLANLTTFIDKSYNILSLLALFDQANQNVLYQAAKFFSLIISLKPNEVVSGLSQSPLGIPRLVELLEGSTAMIRNEIILVIKALANTDNQEIKTVLAFAEAFPRLFSIMEEEGLANGSIIVQDCIQILNSLLKNNNLLANLFRDNGFIAAFAPILLLENETDMWVLTDDRIEILQLALETIMLLVSTGSPTDVYKNQTSIAAAGTLDCIEKMALAASNFPEIRSQALWTLGLLIKGHADNCAKFRDNSFTSFQRAKDQHSVLRVLNIVFNSKVFKERRAACSTFQSYLYDNLDAQIALASTFIPTPEGLPLEDEESIGQIIMGHLSKWASETDTLKHWYACVLLSYVLAKNRISKELLLKIQTDINALPGSSGLIVQIVRGLIHALKTSASIQIQVGFLRLLTTWLDDCPQAVKIFLNAPEHIQFLVEVMPTHTNPHVSGLIALVVGLCAQDDDPAGVDSVILSNKIGTEKFISFLSQLTKTEDFVNAEEGKVHMTSEDSQKIMFYDAEYTRFFRRAYQQILNRVKPNTPGTTSNNLSGAPDSEQKKMTQFYKDLVKTQDQKIVELQTRINMLQMEIALTAEGDVKTTAAKVVELQEEVRSKDSLIDSLTRKCAQLEGRTAPDSEKEREKYKEAKQALKNENSRLKEKITLLKREKLATEQKMRESQQISETNLKVLQERIGSLEESLEGHDDLLVMLAEQDIKLRGYRVQLGLPEEEEDDDDEEEEEEESDDFKNGKI